MIERLQQFFGRQLEPGQEVHSILRPKIGAGVASSLGLTIKRLHIAHLELRAVRPGIGSQIYQPFRQIQRAIVVITDFGDDVGRLVRPYGAITDTQTGVGRPCDGDKVMMVVRDWNERHSLGKHLRDCLRRNVFRG